MRGPAGAGGGLGGSGLREAAGAGSGAEGPGAGSWGGAEGPCGGPGCVRGLGPEPGREELPGALPAHGAPGLGQRGFNGPVGFCRRDSPKGLDREV